jgi:hypothetical protein
MSDSTREVLVGVGVGVGGWWGLATQGVQRYSDLPHLDLVALHQN